MKAIISVWMQPVYARINAGISKTMYVLLGLTMFAPAVVVFLANRLSVDWTAMSLALLAGVGIVLCLLLFFWFFLLIPSIALQYSPANAMLVPGLKRTLQVAVAIPVLLIPTGIALFYFKVNHGDFFVSWLLGVVVLLIYTATIRTQWVFTLIVLISVMPIRFDGKSGFLSAVVWNQPALFMVLGLALTALVLSWVFKSDGDQHYRRKENFAMMQKQMNGEEIASKHYTLDFINPYSLLLHLNMKKVSKKPAKANNLMLFAMGPQVFWLTSFLSVIFMAGLVFAFFAIFGNQSSRFDEKNIALAYFIGLVSLLLLPPIYSSIVRSSVYQRKAEQGLLMLTAGLPNAHEQGKLLLQSMLRQLLGLWLVTTFIFGSAAYLLETSVRLTGLIWITSFCLLPVSVLSLNNYARMKSIYQTSLLAAIGLPLALGLVVIVVCTLTGDVPAWQTCSAITVATVLAICWRWRKLKQTGIIFPAGRAV
ncbi:hypothetical protein [Undibacterium pigrum]|uniref:ABC-2 type transport system permease protein n=1 Tax=Undibacterium pigrum TaxID=401470 RepID=A0A318IR42_9BURK|nr:hypothetical protein [Undibacterium pigrum]PXX37845.1 hypothetical protein DFR42_1144 [Undibacterium pigrum]